MLGFHYRLFVFYFLFFNFALVFEFDKDMQKKTIPIQQNGSLKDEEIQFFLYADESGSLAFETLLESSWNMSYIGNISFFISIP